MPAPRSEQAAKEFIARRGIVAYSS